MATLNKMDWVANNDYLQAQYYNEIGRCLSIGTTVVTSAVTAQTTAATHIISRPDYSGLKVSWNCDYQGGTVGKQGIIYVQFSSTTATSMFAQAVNINVPNEIGLPADGSYIFTDGTGGKSKWYSRSASTAITIKIFVTGYPGASASSMSHNQSWVEGVETN